MSPANCRRFARLATLAALVAAAAASALGTAAAVAAIPVPQLPERIEPVALPPITQTTLPNGLELVVVQRPLRPLALVSLTVPAGHIHDPAGRPGLAGFVAGMLTDGTRTRTSQEIAQAIEFVGGRLAASAGVEATTIDAQVLSKDMQLAMELVADVAMHPVFPEDEIAIRRPQWLAGVRQQFDDPGHLAGLHADTLLYGTAHPLGYFPSEAAVQAITRDDLVAFHRDHYTPDGALLFVVGDVAPERVLELARRYLGSWQPRAATRRPVPPARLEASRVRFVEWPGQTQVRIELRQPGPAATVDDWPAVGMYNYILGGGAFASRLMEVVRARLGQTYDVHTSYGSYRFPSHFSLSTFTRNEQVWQTLEVLKAELERFVREGVTEPEVQDARTFFVFSYPMRLETLDDMAGTIFSALWLGRGIDWVSRYPVVVSRLTVADVNAAIRRYLDPNRFAITLLGDPKVLESAPPAVWDVPIGKVERMRRTDVPRR